MEIIKMTKEEVLNRLEALSNPEKVVFKAKKFGVQTASKTLGIYQKDLKLLAKEIGKNTELGIALFDTEIYEARILCSKICKPKEVTEKMMDTWVETFDTWEICDSFCMELFKFSPYAIEKAFAWSDREEEFVKRAGIVLMAVYGFADKNAENAVFESFFPVLIHEAQDDRIYVKKAVSWALRNIGKRNSDLREKVMRVADEIAAETSDSARWIAKDVLRELKKENVKSLDYPREIYRA
ncbi:DNA alkylation repair protein [Flavicella marina]|uniref:DNA alkylation repair protein n=1 Tax=Flavicella marina TaxID=1475951 RepID=UPI001D02AA38|nr:DNA alkylation repair protein [Flavicella marina]